MRSIIHILILSFLPIISYSQSDTISFKTIEGITDKMLEIISGDIEEDRDWTTFRNLFLPSAQMIFVNPQAPLRKQVNAMNIEEFIRYVGPLYKREGFEEVSIGLTINEFNGMANVFQSFKAKNLTGSFEERGINSYQLLFLNDRWWIASTTFVNETTEFPIPNKYLFEPYRK